MKQSTKLALSVAAAAAAAGLISRRRRRAWPGFRGRVALVTGGSRGLGLEISRELGRRGAKLVICARDAEELESARASLAAEGLDALALVCDVAVPSQVDALVRQARERAGEIDVLVNNAGTIQVGPLENMTPDDFESSLATHFRGPLHACLAVLPGMRERRSGRIVNISSIGGRIAVPHLLPYAAGKFALAGLSEGLRAELARDGVFVTTVCPGLMRTGSAINAWFKGRHRSEYAWFAISDSVPVLSMGSRKAARRIVEACRRGDADLVLTPAAKLAAAFHGIFPGTTAALLSAANRLLPAPNGARAIRGSESESLATRLLVGRSSREAEKRNNERRDRP